MMEIQEVELLCGNFKNHLLDRRSENKNSKTRLMHLEVWTNMEK